MFDKILKISGVVSAVVGIGEVAFKILGMLPAQWKKISSWWNGKKIAVIGATASGKNCFFAKLCGDDLPSEYNQTRGSEKINKFKVNVTLPNNEEINLTCKGCQNIGGETDERERFWLPACDEADIVFYLIDITKFNNDNLEIKKSTIKRVNSDLAWMMEHISKFKKDVKIYMFFNKVDLLLSEEDECLADNENKILQTEKNKLLAIVKNTFGVENQYRIAGMGLMSTHRGFYKYFNQALVEIYNNDK